MKHLPTLALTFFLSQIHASVNEVTDWNATLLQAVRSSSTNPPKASRQMAMVNLAVHDALMGINRTHQPYLVQTSAPGGASKEAAVAAAAKTVLDSLYTGNATVLADISAAYTTRLAAVPAGAAKTDGVNWGTFVGNEYISLRAADGSTVSGSYTAAPAPGVWRPTLPANGAALLPGWSNVTPFGLLSGGQFRPHQPPVLTGASYATELDQVKSLGSSTSATRTEDQTEIALFWADGGGTETPPGHWMRIASDLAVDQGLTLEESGRLLALLGMTVADAGIACWDGKYVYNNWRPITAIREADTDGNPSTTEDPAWSPLIATPPFPEYTSGHSTFSRASATILKNFFGTDAMPFSTTSDGLPDVTRAYAGFGEAADDAGMSRIYGGIHFASANIAGQTVGHLTAGHNWSYFLQPFASLSFAAVSKGTGSFSMAVNVTPNVLYKVKASSDLVSWEVIGTLSSMSGTLTFTDMNAPAGKRFYQVGLAN